MLKLLFICTILLTLLFHTQALCMGNDIEDDIKLITKKRMFSSQEILQIKKTEEASSHKKKKV